MGSTQGVKARPTPSAKNSSGVHQFCASLLASESWADVGALSVCGSVVCVDVLVLGSITRFDSALNGVMSITRVSGG
ncbi:Uncharacterised protein [Vibrio cholerae]|uniref:Uncharacterized protein n=1 Tax=Vibrio cholerae TaxID=666 RepID=A0A655XD30_VIBCL|nr:Uncharacterised protein [Vibrio cholerae]CSB78413.1 Uncharacterised protein [Vibrio cholerae]CSB92340.1 Uncharacterised protein [Vibrio cholerae]CSB94660.1 Uncharacterised protein [Vibrio cholerae]CSC09540.1 Uncharacterised protein [Vibrio cholerae]